MRFLQALFATAFLGIFVLVGLGVLIGLGLKPWWEGRAYAHWRTVPCTIVGSPADAEGPEAAPGQGLRFRFSWLGTDRIGTRLRPGAEPLSAREIDEAAAEYPLGKETTCAVDPADPGTAALEVPHGPAGGELAFLVVWAALFAGIPGALLAVVWRNALGKAPVKDPGEPQRMSAKQGKAAFAMHKATAVLAPPKEVPGGFRLEPGSGRLAGAVAIGIFAAFWNGITWTGVISMWREEHGVMAIGLMAFMSIFVLVGLALAGVFAYLLLKALFTPRIGLLLADRQLTPGKSATLHWSIERGRERLQDLRIDLVLREESSYRRGTDTITDRHEVRVVPLWSGTEPDAEGRGTVTPPADLPPSLEGGSNRLVWCLRLQGAVGGLPDVDDEYPVLVAPSQEVFGALVADGDAQAEEDGGILVLDGGTAVAAGSTVRGSFTRRDGFRLRLLRTITGKGDTEQEEACYASLEGPCGFLLTVPSRPTSWPGTVVGVRWTLEADTASGANNTVVELDVR